MTDDAGKAHFQLAGLTSSFTISAGAGSGNFNLQVYFDNLYTVNMPVSSTINLGWNHDGSMPFILSGTSGNFWSTNPPTAWMQKLLPVIWNRTLREVVMPGSHDSGMSALTGSTVGGVTGNVLTQTLNIGGQLAMGARYFDIRPVIANGIYTTGHYSYLNSALGWQGGNGETIDDIVSQINAFTATNAELIILNLSHDLDTDAANSAYTSLSQNQYTALLAKLATINHLYLAPNPESVDLTTLTVGQFISLGYAAVVVICAPGDSSVTLGNYVQRGFYRADQLNPVNLYSNSNSLSNMALDQIGKLEQYRESPDSQMFLLSWTLTQQVTDMAKLTSIITLANQANNAIYAMVMPKVDKDTFPNILYIDNIADSNIAALAVAMNHIISPAVSGRDVEEAERSYPPQARHLFQRDQ